MSTDENDIVLDPFNGTGTTALAAKRLGRQYIGFELDSEYVEITKNKLAQEKPNSKLGDCWVSFYLDKIVTLRDCDWEKLKDYFFIPNKPEEIDQIPIVLKSKVTVSSPFKNGYKTETNEFRLFENEVVYHKNGVHSEE
jgi:site-specific DNA-methyltransferase (adenine-specific)